MDLVDVDRDVHEDLVEMVVVVAKYLMWHPWCPTHHLVTPLFQLSNLLNMHLVRML